jgi:hypothetical protein
VLVQGGGVIGEKTDKTDRPTVPKFSLMMCCNGMALTFCPENPTDPTSLEIRTRLNNWKFRRLGKVQPGSLENPPRVSKKSARAVKSVAPFFL